MDDKEFRIEVSSRYGGFWRYNVALTCGCFDAEGNRTDFITAASHVADVGSGLTEAPADLPADRTTVLTTRPCNRLLCYLYIIPHTLPEVDGIEAAEPFDLEVRIFRDGRKLRTEKLRINQWSGASVELRAGTADQG